MSASRKKASIGPRVLSVMALLGAAVSWLWPAIYNGYPLVFTDSFHYIGNAFDFAFHPRRSTGYPLFLRASGVSVSLWLPVAIQTIVTMAVWARAAWLLTGLQPMACAGLMMGLALVTTAPKYASWVVADITTSWAVAGAIILLTSRSTGDRVTAAALVVVASLCHKATGITTVIAALAVLVLGLFAKRKQEAKALLVIVAGGLAAMAADQLVLSGLRRGPPITGNATALLSRFHDFGLLARTLKEHCATKTWGLCRDANLIEAHDKKPEWYLWSKLSPRNRFGESWDTPEVTELSNFILKENWPEILLYGLESGFAQIINLHPGEAIERRMDPQATAPAIRRYVPTETNSLLTSAQARGQARVQAIPFDESLSYLAALLLLTRIAFGGWWARSKGALAYTFVIAYVLANAFVLGGLSGSWGRYQGRLGWIPVFVCAAVFLGKRRKVPGRLGNSIDYFGHDHWLTPIQERVSVRARRKMFDLWREFAAVSAREPFTILDAGTTPDVKRQDSNCLLDWLLAETRCDLALCSPEDLTPLRLRFHAARFLRQIDGKTLPAADRAYDWVLASAVLEHVGGEQVQRQFICELGRVADGVFLTTPNRWHWLEFHTKIPLLHWLPRFFHRALLKLGGHDFWAQESNLRLLSERDLARLARQALGDAFDVSVRRIWFLGMPSNLVLLARRRNEPLSDLQDEPHKVSA